MEQTTQQIIQKSSLPTMTKIAASWLIIISKIGIIIFILFLIGFFLALIKSECTAAYFFILPFLGIPSFLIFFLGSFLSKKKKWAWWLNIVMLLIILLSSGYLIVLAIKSNIIYGYTLLDFKFLIYVILFFLSILPLTFLLLDRKNFFKIAS